MGGRGSGKKTQRKQQVSVLGNLLFLGLWFGAFGSAVGVVYSAFKARQSTHQLEMLRKESNTLQVRSGQYLLEKSTWAAYARVEDIAVNKLKMQVPDSSKTVLVKRQ